MRVGYLHLPRAPVQRRVLEQPSLAGRPVVLHAEEKGSEKVRFASGAALRKGIRPGSTVASALALEPTTVRLRFDPAAEARALASLGERLLPFAPGFQIDPPEGLWLDASAAPLSGSEERWAARVLAACREQGLLARCVVGSERFSTQAVARWAEAPPSVLAVHGMPELAGLPLVALEEGWLGADAMAPFRALGLSTLGELAALPSGALGGRFGAMGFQAARLARGDDDSGFLADAIPELLEEQVQLDWPAEQLEPVLFALKTLVDRLCGRLQGRQRAAVRLTVTVGLEGGSPLVVPLVLARASSEGRLLIELIRHRLTDLTVQQPITTLHVRVDEASLDAGRQLVLGDAPSGEVELEVVLSRLQSALGEAALFSAEAMASHAPESAWRMGPPLPKPEPALAAPPPPPPRKPVTTTPGAWPKRKAKVEQRGVVSLPTFETRPPRLFADPTPLALELTTGQGLGHAVLAGRRRQVQALFGPERLVGGWWGVEPVVRDYYRVQLEGVGQLWVFRDGRDGAFYAHGVFD